MHTTNPQHSPTAQPVNLLNAMLHTNGLRCHVTDLVKVTPVLLAHLRADASLVSALAARVELLAQQWQLTFLHGRASPGEPAPAGQSELSQTKRQTQPPLASSVR